MCICGSGGLWRRVEVSREGRFPEVWEGMGVKEGPGWELTRLQKGGQVLGAGYTAPASAKIPLSNMKFSRKDTEFPYSLRTMHSWAMSASVVTIVSHGSEVLPQVFCPEHPVTLPRPLRSSSGYSYSSEWDNFLPIWQEEGGGLR